MTRIIEDPADVLKRAHQIGAYYGFTPFSSAAFAARGRAAKETAPDAPLADDADHNAREIAGFLRRVKDAGLAPAPGAPLFLWHANAAPGRTGPKTVIVQFHALGADRAIADAVLIRAVRALVADLAAAEPALRVNSMGDKETRARLVRELSSFFRKRAAALPPESLELARKDVLAAAELLLRLEDHGLPSPTDHLSEASRKHFEALLEYLEETETPYELAPYLIARNAVWGETCFEVHAGERIHAWGSRYHELARPFFKAAPSAVGAVVRIATSVRAVIPPFKERSAPRFVFVHIGDEAKRTSIRMADDLRKARIPLSQVLGVESLSEQMRLADALNPRYLLIMGRKEALEGSVILRERATHTESLIPLSSLVEKLKAVA